MSLVLFFWLLRFNDFCFAIGGFLVCSFLSESKTSETWKKFTFWQHILPLFVALTIRRNESKAIHPCEEFSNEDIVRQDCQQAVREATFNSQIWKKTDLPGDGVHLMLSHRTESGRVWVWQSGAKGWVFTAQEFPLSSALSNLIIPWPGPLEQDPWKPKTKRFCRAQHPQTEVHRNCFPLPHSRSKERRKAKSNFC